MRTSFALQAGEFDPELGEVAQTTEEANQYEQQGWVKCDRPGCWFYASPEGIQYLGKYEGSQYTCPNCGTQQQVLDDWQIVDPSDPRKTARAGMSLAEMGKMGEAAVYEAAQGPEWKERYGEIIWWQPGAMSLATGDEHGKFDGYSQKGDVIYAIEVKSANAATKQGQKDPRGPQFGMKNSERDSKHDYAANFATYEPDLARDFGVQKLDNVPEVQRDYTPSQLKRKNRQNFNEPPAGKIQKHYYDQGNNDIDALLAVLPVFDFDKSEVDIYVREMPLSGHQGGAAGNQTYHGFVKFRPDDQYRLVSEVPFRNPYMDWQNNEQLIVKPSQMFNFEPPTPEQLLFQDEQPQPQQRPNEDLPF